MSLDPRAAAGNFVLRFCGPLSVGFPKRDRAGAGELAEAALRWRNKRDLDAALAMIAAAPQDDLLDGRWLDVNSLLDASAPGDRAPLWLGRRCLGGKVDRNAFADWLERTAFEAASADVRYVSGPAHVVSALMNIAARARVRAKEPPFWTRLGAIQVCDCDGAHYAPLLRLHAPHPVRIVEALWVPRFGTVAVATPTDELVLLLDRGLAFELANVERVAERVPLWESEPGADYELCISSPADELFGVASGIVVRCAGRSPLKFTRLASSHRIVVADSRP